MAQHRVTVPAYEPEAQARVSPTLACASGLYHLCGESQECYPNRSYFEPCRARRAIEVKFARGVRRVRTKCVQARDGVTLPWPGVVKQAI